MKRKNRLRVRRLAALLLTLLLAAAFLTPLGASAQSSKKVVRVGWYESPFNQTDELGRRTGYAYDYQQRIAAYTGWTYEYVEGSWPDLLQMLIDGRIDLLSDVSYTEARAEKMLYATLPMGAEEYYLFISPKNAEISADDYSTFNGQRVGVNKSSVQEGFFRDWAAANGVEAEIVELNGTEEGNLAALNRGDIDMYVTMDAYYNTSSAVPLCKVGASVFYFVVSKDRPELLTELNTALSRIESENPTYQQDLNARYIRSTAVNLYLSAAEKAWLDEHGPIRVGYRDNYLAFCAQDTQTGELIGALREYLRAASDCLANAHLDFEPVAFSTSEAAMEALKNGEVDCMFPANLTEYDGEVQGYFMTPAVMHTDMSAVIRAADQKDFAKKERVTVAVNVGNPNYDMFLIDHFPDWRPIYYKDTAECLKAIADGQADTLLISSYRYNNIASLCQKYDLVTLSTGVEMDDCFAVRRDDTTLYSILSKTTGVVPAASINSALAFYFTEDARTTFGDLIRQNMRIVFAAIGAVALVLLLLILRSVRAEKKVSAEQRLISATETDELTGLYSKNYFFEYAERMYREHPDKPMDVIALNIDQFRALTALKGESFGDQTLQVLGSAIHAFLTENGGIAGRMERDRFAVYCPHEEDCRPLLDRLQGALDNLSPETSIRLRMGVMPWQEGMEPQQMFEQAHTACTLARGNVRDHMVVFDDKLRERMAFEQRLLGDLRHAVENREFVVYYQPKFDIRTEPPTLKSAEALVRWQHPELGTITSDRFISLLERNGQIGLVDRYVWDESARQIAAWKAKYGVAVPISVNLSRLDLYDLTLESALDALLEENGLDHSDLRLEVTEAACTENAHQVIDVIERLRRRGFEIEIDDFGSGYSSLNLLSNMSIDMLKIDRDFISKIDREEKERQFVELILGIAKTLHVPVIAEGVETEAQLRLLKDLGCAQAQGNYLSSPLPASEFEAAIIG